MKKGLIFCFLILASFCRAQTSIVTSKIIDSVIEKTSKILSFDSDKSSKYGVVRIIDLTKAIGRHFEYYKNIRIITKTRVPLNLNNGEYRDIIFYYFSKNKSLISLKAILSAYEANNEGIHASYSANFIFRIDGTTINIIKAEIGLIDIWDGYINNHTNAAK
ncbi:MAG TPA: hypothetical protein VK622_00675 [Puia sp.]|nr:hypothetical protein [Puia sp.]